jgi:hypothetical protein
MNNAEERARAIVEQADNKMLAHCEVVGEASRKESGDGNA